MPEFLTYKTFYSEEQAASLSEFLSQHSIHSKIVRAKFIMDKMYAGEPIANEISLQLKAADFSRANTIIESSISSNLSQIDPDYYLFSYSDQELIELLNAPDTWSIQDVVVAKKILADRGIQYSPSEIAEIKNQRMEILGKPEAADKTLIIIGYCISILFPSIGVITGLIFSTTRKLLPNGVEVKAYDKATRKHGENMTVIGVIVLLIGLGSVIKRSFELTLLGLCF